MELVWPARGYLPGYVDALHRGWSRDNIRPRAAAEEDFAAITRDPDDFLAKLVDREGKGPRLRLPDGSSVPRLPGFYRWMWDGEFAGVISLRWQPGTSALPPYCLGHIGYSVVPWKEGRGYAKQALKLTLEAAREEGLEHVDITTDPDNVASQRVILANGGVLIERFIATPQYGGGERLRYRIVLGRDEV